MSCRENFEKDNGRLVVGLKAGQQSLDLVDLIERDVSDHFAERRGLTVAAKPF